MKCFNCGFKTRTIYPKLDGIQYVQKMCLACGWKSYPTAVIRLEAAKNRGTENLEAQACSPRPRSE